MAFMSYLTRRGATWHFRYKLPDDLRGREVPKAFPASLRQLVNERAGRFKTEWTQSLRTPDNSVARQRAGVLIADSELLVRESRRFLTEGPPRTLPDDVIAFLAARHVNKLLTEDDALRQRGIGITSLLEPIRRQAAASLAIPGSEPLLPPSPRAGMTYDDLDFWRVTIEKLDRGLRLAVALRSSPNWVRSAVDEALAEQGVELAQGGPDRDALELGFLQATQMAVRDMQRRNEGDFVATPVPPSDPQKLQGPRLSEAFEAWRTGSLLPGMKVPAHNSAVEAEFVVRRFRELHGDVRIGAITREQARAFHDALWRLRKRTDPATTRRYADAMEAGAAFPPITVAVVDGAPFLIDGWHRVAAAKGIGRRDIEAIIVDAPPEQHAWLAARENLKNGLPLRRDESRAVFRAYIRAGQHRKSRKRLKSSREIASDLNGIRSHVTILKWIGQDFPKLRHAMRGEAGYDASKYTQELLPPQDHETHMINETLGYLDEARKCHRGIKDPVKRGELIAGAEALVVEMKAQGSWTPPPPEEELDF